MLHINSNEKYTFYRKDIDINGLRAVTVPPSPNAGQYFKESVKITFPTDGRLRIRYYYNGHYFIEYQNSNH